jgi:hypothetical protein
MNVQSVLYTSDAADLSNHRKDRLDFIRRDRAGQPNVPVFHCNGNVFGIAHQHLQFRLYALSQRPVADESFREPGDQRRQPTASALLAAGETDSDIWRP